MRNPFACGTHLTIPSLIVLVYLLASILIAIYLPRPFTISLSAVSIWVCTPIFISLIRIILSLILSNVSCKNVGRIILPKIFVTKGLQEYIVQHYFSYFLYIVINLPRPLTLIIICVIAYEYILEHSWKSIHINRHGAASAASFLVFINIIFNTIVLQGHFYVKVTLGLKFYVFLSGGPCETIIAFEVVFLRENYFIFIIGKQDDCFGHKSTSIPESVS